MNTIKLRVNKANVYDEVAKTTSYAGAKTQNDTEAYSRIFTTDADRLMLERFWVEACNSSTEEFKRFVVSVNEQPRSHGVELGRDYEVVLEISSMFDVNLAGSMETSLFSYFVNTIVAKWLKFINKDDAGSYAAEAMSSILDVRRKLYYRKKPRRIEI
ncbi:MAG: hypothetical protein SPF56_08585 [Bacteroidaceae bacterium]|nr:hypothetical protein [Bacteroidaceae bacterium]